MVIGGNNDSSQSDGAWKIDFVQQIGESAGSHYQGRWQIPQYNQRHAPRRWPAFYLAVRGLVASAPPHPHPNLSDATPDTDKTKGSSWLEFTR
jgi:hypothetical protein